ncbi:hypothetical protein CAXC1_180007 [Candidatus Xenohaliotis californiensis]|uniref:Uncharacterized protein n=1 Tax=Candidatus Xenohaliotis californiensis TaxID=84677 RepID=A0ABM9N7F4_9RICK|nr:hypothetical protein CAXC1_180007 [Candidatus Xenohaliotis californiensis]
MNIFVCLNVCLNNMCFCDSLNF